jgi:large subunit ribosomal protein L4
MELTYFASDGQSSRQQSFDGIPVFEGDKGIPALKSTVLSYQANARQGNAYTKTRGEVSGTGRKPWRQKGTGMARHGSRRSPIWPGGGVVSGPRGRDYSQKINRRVKLLALGRALFERVNEKSLSLVESFKMEQPKTRLMHAFIEKVCPQASSVLLVDDHFDDNVILAARNIPHICLLDAASVNAWDVIRFDQILFTERGLSSVLSRLNAEKQS